MNLKPKRTHRGVEHAGLSLSRSSSSAPVMISERSALAEGIGLGEAIRKVDQHPGPL